MKVLRIILSATVLVGVFVMAPSPASAQTTEFTYQGKLNDGGFAANANYDFEFRLFDSVTAGSQVGPLLTRSNIAVGNGIFSVALDFGSAFPGANRFLEIGVRNAGGGLFTTLAPRQKIASAPFSIRTLGANSADSLSANCVLCITDAQIQSIGGDKVTGTVASATSAATAVNVSGVVQIANGGTGSSTKTFVDLTTNQTNIAGNKTFTGILSGNGSGLTNITATVADGSITTSKLADGSVTEAKLASNLVNSPERNLGLLGSLRWDLLKGQNDFTAGTAPRGLAFDGSNIWVTNQTSNNVTKLRASDGANLGTFPVGTGPIGIAFDGANMWVMNGGSSNLTKLRASDGANLGTIASVSGFDVVFDGANIWVASFNGGMVGKYRTSDGSNLGFFAAGNFPRGLVFDGANIWVSNQNDAIVRKLRASDGAIVGGLIPTGTGPSAIAFDGANVWVVNGTSNNVTKLRASDGANQGTFSVGTSPRGIAFDGTNVWITHSTGITKLRASDGAFLGTLTANSPQGIAFDGMNMWVTGTSDVRRMVPAFP